MDSKNKDTHGKPAPRPRPHAEAYPVDDQGLHVEPVHSAFDPREPMHEYEVMSSHPAEPKRGPGHGPKHEPQHHPEHAPHPRPKHEAHHPVNVDSAILDRLLARLDRLEAKEEREEQREEEHEKRAAKSAKDDEKESKSKKPATQAKKKPSKDEDESEDESDDESSDEDKDTNEDEDQEEDSKKPKKKASQKDTDTEDGDAEDDDADEKDGAKKDESKDGKGKKKKKVKWTGKRIAVVAVVALIMIGGGSYFFYEQHTYESTDDAMVQAHTTMLAPKVAGIVTQVLVDEHQAVHAGDVLVRLESKDYQAGMASSKAALEALQVQAANARRDLERAKALYQDHAITHQGLDHAQATYQDLDRQAKGAKASLEQSKLNLDYTELRAPTDGYVSRKSVEVGMNASEGMALLGFVQTNERWVIANFKETQLDSVKIGKQVDVTVDAIPGRKYHGLVESISPSSGATFTLFPPDNATGNYTKVVQRVPVKIYLKNLNEDDLKLLQAGLSAEVSVIKHSDPEKVPSDRENYTSQLAQSLPDASSNTQQLNPQAVPQPQANGQPRPAAPAMNSRANQQRQAVAPQTGGQPPQMDQDMNKPLPRRTNDLGDTMSNQQAQKTEALIRDPKKRHVRKPIPAESDDLGDPLPPMPNLDQGLSN